jgi:hypothetical protein
LRGAGRGYRPRIDDSRRERLRGLSGLDPRLSKAVTAHSLIVAALGVVHSLRIRGLRRTLLFAVPGSAIPTLSELVAVNVVKVVRHHAQPQVRGVPLAIVLLWYNVCYGSLILVKGNTNRTEPHISKESLALAPAVALVATSLDLLLDPFGLDQGLWEWSGDGPYASEVEGPNGKRGVPLLNFAGWIALTTSVTLAYQRLETGRNAAYTSDPGDTGGPGSQRAAALLLLSYYLPAAVWALTRGKRRHLLYSAPFALVSWVALKERSATS